MRFGPIWPVTLECGDLVLRPIRYRDKKEWTEVRSRNSEWLAPWEASNPDPRGGLPDYRQMVRSLNAQAAQATALPFVITERTAGLRNPPIIGQLTVSSIVWGSAMMATLGYWVDQARAGRAINELVRSGAVRAPVVIGRDHLDSGSVASPYRETEAMRDGSDAIADWPILNALVNTAAGATWVSVHHGGGVGIGNSIHAGMVVLADGSADAADRLERVLTADPGTGVMRHADAGYEEALDAARDRGLDFPSV